MVLPKVSEDAKGLYKTFWGTTKKCGNKNLTQFLFQYNFQKCTGWAGSTLKYIMLQKGQTQFKNFTALASKFLKCVWRIWNIMHWSRWIGNQRKFSIFRERNSWLVYQIRSSDSNVIRSFSHVFLWGHILNTLYFHLN